MSQFGVSGPALDTVITPIFAFLGHSTARGVSAHIARYHHLLALVQAERFFEPAGASVKAKEWLAWAHFVCWVLVGHTQPRSSMLLTLPVALPLRIVLNGHCGDAIAMILAPESANMTPMRSTPALSR